MKRKVGKPTNHHYHHYNFDGLWGEMFKWVIVLIIVLSLTTAFENEINRDRIIYGKCVSACSEKHFWGLEVGIDGWGERYYPVQEFDRTDCILSCNELYLNSRGIEK